MRGQIPTGWVWGTGDARNRNPDNKLRCLARSSKQDSPKQSSWERFIPRSADGRQRFLEIIRGWIHRGKERQAQLILRSPRSARKRQYTKDTRDAIWKAIQKQCGEPLKERAESCHNVTHIRRVFLKFFRWYVTRNAGTSKSTDGRIWRRLKNWESKSGRTLSSTYCCCSGRASLNQPLNINM